MKPLDLQKLRAAIRSVAIDLHSRGVTDPGAAIVAFHDRHDELAAEFAGYGFNRFLAGELRGAMKRVREDISAALGSRQVGLPLEFDGLEIPDMLPISRQIEGEKRAVWVTRDDGTVEDGDAYGVMLKANVMACQQNLVDWETFWKPVRELLLQHDGWRIGDALRFLTQ